MLGLRWFIIFLISSLCIFTGRYILTRLIAKKGIDEFGKNEQKNILTYPLIYRVSLLGCTIGFLALGILCLLTTEKSEDRIYGSTIFFVISGLCFLVCIMCSLWKVKIKENGFIYRNWCGVQKYHYFADMAYKENSSGSKFWFYRNNRKIICVSYMINNESSLSQSYFSWCKQKKINPIIQKNTQDNVMTFYLSLRIVMFCCAFVMTALGVMVSFLGDSQEDLIVAILFFGVALFGFCGFIAGMLWKVEIQEDGFVYRNYFGIKKTYKFTELEYKENLQKTKQFFYKNGKKIICITYFIENTNALFEKYLLYQNIESQEYNERKNSKIQRKR